MIWDSNNLDGHVFFYLSLKTICGVTGQRQIQDQPNPLYHYMPPYITVLYIYLTILLRNYASMSLKKICNFESSPDILIVRYSVGNVKSTVKIVITLIWISQNNVNGHKLIPALFKIIDMTAFDDKKFQNHWKSWCSWIV